MRGLVSSFTLVLDKKENKLKMTFIFQYKFTDKTGSFLKFVTMGLNKLRKVDFSVGKEHAAN